MPRYWYNTTTISPALASNVRVNDGDDQPEHENPCAHTNFAGRVLPAPGAHKRHHDIEWHVPGNGETLLACARLPFLDVMRRYRAPAELARTAEYQPDANTGDADAYRNKDIHQCDPLTGSSLSCPITSADRIALMRAGDESA